MSLLLDLLLLRKRLKQQLERTDDPLIFVTNTFLASDADPLNVATEELIAWSVTVKEALKAELSPTNRFLASEAEPLKAATDELID